MLPRVRVVVVCVKTPFAQQRAEFSGGLFVLPEAVDWLKDADLKRVRAFHMGQRPGGVADIVLRHSDRKGRQKGVTPMPILHHAELFDQIQVGSHALVRQGATRFLVVAPPVFAIADAASVSIMPDEDLACAYALCVLQDLGDLRDAYDALGAVHHKALDRPRCALVPQGCTSQARRATR